MAVLRADRRGWRTHLRHYRGRVLGCESHLCRTGLLLRAAVIGDPVEHSRSPAIHLAAARATGVDLDYVALRVRPDELSSTISMVRETGMRGLSVTMPHKTLVSEEMNELTESAKVLGAVNHVTNTDGHLVGNNTDGEGFLLGLSHAHDIDVRDLHIGVFGAGGAARAIILACARADAASISVVARDRERAWTAAHVAGPVATATDIDAFEGSHLVVNATPVGMAATSGAGEVPFDVAALRADAVVVDIVYEPLETVLLGQARARGLRGVDGLAMLAGQASAQFSAWTGVAAPLDVMIAAAGAPPESNPSIS